MADVTLEELYKSLQAADLAGDKLAAQKLADYIRMLSAMPRIKRYQGLVL